MFAFQINQLQRVDHTKYIFPRSILFSPKKEVVSMLTCTPFLTIANVINFGKTFVRSFLAVPSHFINVLLGHNKVYTRILNISLIAGAILLTLRLADVYFSSFLCSHLHRSMNFECVRIFFYGVRGWKNALYKHRCGGPFRFIFIVENTRNSFFQSVHGTYEFLKRHA